jgi:excisionase family DNA binding protein
VTAEYWAALRLVAESLPTGAAVPVPREQLLAILGSEPTSRTPQVSDALLQVEQVAERLGVGPQWVYRHQKALGAVRVGRALRFPPAAVARFVERRAVTRL